MKRVVGIISSVLVLYGLLMLAGCSEDKIVDQEKPDPGDGPATLANRIDRTNEFALDLYGFLSFSGDGRRFQLDVHVMDADGSNETALTNVDGVEENPVWSPDGSRIVFQTMKDGNFEIYVMKDDGSNWRNLTNDPGHDYWPSWVSTGDENTSEQSLSCPCLRSELEFDVSSVEKIILQPEMVLDDAAEFWQQDEAYKLVKKWHENTRQPLDMENWRKRIERFRGLTQEERESHPQAVAARGLAEIEQPFARRAVRYLCDFLPPQADLSTTLYFTTEIMASGFQQDGDIVVNILNHELQNLFLHEVFHRGYSSIYWQNHSEPITDPILLMYLSLHNEGMATYVSYSGLHEFPNFRENDYNMLEDAEKVKSLYAELNQLLRDAQRLDPGELRTRAWELGVQRRAYYVVGAYMAQVIDQKLGRPALVATVQKGLSAFVSAYNSVAAEDMKVYEPPS